MDDTRFDQVARALGAATSRRGALVAIGAALAAGTALGSPAAARRRRCNPRCPVGQTCDRPTRTCTCDNGGTVCGANCCTEGQTCADGQCANPPQTCIPAGSPCKDTGRACCDGRVCASGQGGQGDIACNVPAGGACQATADCVWFAECEGGVCVDRQPTPEPACVPAFQPGPDPRANGAALQAAIDAAPDGGTVLVAPGVYEREVEISPKDAIAFTVTRPVTIRRCGDGEVVLQRNGWSFATVSIVDSGPVELDGLTITDAGGPYRYTLGVAIEWKVRPGARKPEVTLRNCSVSDNQGGGVACWREMTKDTARIPVQIENCTIRGNLGAGGHKHGVYAEKCSLDVRGSRIVGNVSGETNVMWGMGGGINLSSADLSLRGSEVSGNTAIGTRGFKGTGGGIYASGPSTLVIHAGSTVTGNVAGGSEFAAGTGSGVYADPLNLPAPTVTIAPGAVFGNDPAENEVCTSVACA